MSNEPIENGDSGIKALIEKILLLNIFGINRKTDGYYDILNRDVKVEDLYSRLAFIQQVGGWSDEQIISIMKMSQSEFADDKDCGGRIAKAYSFFHKEHFTPEEKKHLCEEFGIFTEFNYEDAKESMPRDKFKELMIRILELEFPYEKFVTFWRATSKVLPELCYAKFLERNPDGISLKGKDGYSRELIDKLQEIIDISIQEVPNVTPEIATEISAGDEISDELGETLKLVEERYGKLVENISDLVKNVFNPSEVILGSTGKRKSTGNGKSSELSLQNPVESNVYMQQAVDFLQRVKQMTIKYKTLIYDDKSIILPTDNAEYFPFRINGFVVLEPFGHYSNATYVMTEKEYDMYIEQYKREDEKKIRFPSKEFLKSKGCESYPHKQTRIQQEMLDYIEKNPNARSKFKGKRLYDFKSEHFFRIIDAVASYSEGESMAERIKRALNNVDVERQPKESRHHKKDDERPI